MKIFPGQTARIGSTEYTLIREKILMGFCYAFWSKDVLLVCTRGHGRQQFHTSLSTE